MAPRNLGRDVRAFASKTRREGIAPAARRAREVLGNRNREPSYEELNPERVTFTDVLFINGCDYCVPHPIRYRVDHQIEQLEAAGITCGRVDSWNVSPDMAGDARSFVIFRCPYTPEIGEFIKLAKSLNKKVYYDIDDLVIDRKYTDTIPYLATMSPEERAAYDDGVDRMGRTLVECGSAITTTERLAEELSGFVGEVFVNRNVASERMVSLSEKALYERDVLPSLGESQVPDGERSTWESARKGLCERRASGSVTIGYFSGSITHNADFELVLPAIAQVMGERDHVRLRVVGELDVPDGLAAFRDRIDFSPFCPWEELPGLIAGVDINIAPLEESVFNEAKSENKWVEASLVKVPTVASDIGAFSKMIEDGATGVLCSDVAGWHDALIDLVDHPKRRARIASAAYEWCRAHATTMSTGHALASHLRANQTPNVFFEMPGLDTSGGVLVVLKHASMLQDAGIDVTLIDNSRNNPGPWFDFEGHRFAVRFIRSEVNKDRKCLLRGRIDQGVATFWDTLPPLLDYGNVGRVRYLVQNFEPGFYAPSTPLRVPAAATYGHDGVEYLTISKWCQGWLASDFGQTAMFVPNGIDTEAFVPSERDFSGRVRILVEGDSASAYKNVDEAFRIVDRLDPERFEVWYMSYNAGPKSTYRVDRFLNKVPHDEVGDVYRQCHILLKTSVLESFSYPPIEMMATGGLVVVLPNGGNAEYVRDGENCLTYERGDLDGAVAAIERICSDANLRRHLREGGLETAGERDWGALANEIVNLYR